MYVILSTVLPKPTKKVSCCNAGSMVMDSYEGIRTCDLRVSVLIRGYRKGSLLGHLGIPGQLIAFLFVAQWIERWCANLAAQF